MPKSPDTELAVERFTAGAGRFGLTLQVSPMSSAQLKAVIKVMDVEHTYDADDPGTDEITLEAITVESKTAVAGWLESDVISKTVNSDFFHRRPMSNILELQNAVIGLVRQLLGTRDRAADVKK